MSAAKNIKVYIGDQGLTKSWQAEFPKTTTCCRCGGIARHGFTVFENYSGAPGKDHVCDLYPNEPPLADRNGNHAASHTSSDGENGYWLHDCCAVAVYFCKDCLETTALYNQA